MVALLKQKLEDVRSTLPPSPMSRANEPRPSASRKTSRPSTSPAPSRPTCYSFSNVGFFPPNTPAMAAAKSPACSATEFHTVV